MIKNKDVVIRINEDLKNKLKDKSKSIGLSISSYIRMLITKELE